MSTSLSERVNGAVLVLQALAAAPAGERASPWYPERYRRWTATRFRLHGPEATNYERQGGFRRYLANFFTGADTTTGLAPEQAKAACFDARHRTQEARDFVFSDPRC